jgi:hypothetical protein
MVGRCGWLAVRTILPQAPGINIGVVAWVVLVYSPIPMQAMGL